MISYYWQMAMSKCLLTEMKQNLMMILNWQVHLVSYDFFPVFCYIVNLWKLMFLVVILSSDLTWHLSSLSVLDLMLKWERSSLLISTPSYADISLNAIWMFEQCNLETCKHVMNSTFNNPNRKKYLWYQV